MHCVHAASAQLAHALPLACTHVVLGGMVRVCDHGRGRLMPTCMQASTLPTPTRPPPRPPSTRSRCCPPCWRSRSTGAPTACPRCWPCLLLPGPGLLLPPSARRAPLSKPHQAALSMWLQGCGPHRPMGRSSCARHQPTAAAAPAWTARHARQVAHAAACSCSGRAAQPGARRQGCQHSTKPHQCHGVQDGMHLGPPQVGPKWARLARCLTGSAFRAVRRRRCMAARVRSRWPARWCSS